MDKKKTNLQEIDFQFPCPWEKAQAEIDPTTKSSIGLNYVSRNADSEVNIHTPGDLTEAKPWILLS